MARKKSTVLTDAELRVMEVLWTRGRASVAEVTDAIHPSIAYTTVLTTLRILEKKGHVRHEAAGRAFLYSPTIEREAAAQSALSGVVSKFFGNNSGALALRLIESERPSDEELARLRSLIERYEEQP
ncbi:MAG TPA: BlaI/MecI/CopY family transcriptional regulator [Candidatus Dormibacteraeota bacterium]|nr:BlaI/MecI/CopY family transcriptional regulator [Candidatus Dormibacteraeota bacterium]